MGTYDTFVDTNGTVEHQSKAFGRGLRTFRPGDTVTLLRAPFTEAEFNDYMAGEWDPTPERDAISYEAQCGGNTYVCVRRGVFVGFSTKPDTNLPIFDYHGRDITDLTRNMDDPAFASRREQTMALTYAHGLVIRAAYHDRAHDRTIRTVRTETVNEAVACLLSYCNTYQCDIPAGVPEPRAYRQFLNARDSTLRSLRNTTPRVSPLMVVGATATAPVPNPAQADGPAASAALLPDVSTVPSSLFVLSDNFQVVQPYPTTVAALADDPTMSPQQIADVFVNALGTLRALPDVGFLMRPTPRALGRRGTVVPDPGWSGEERFALYVAALRKAGLVAVGPGWSGRERPTR